MWEVKPKTRRKDTEREGRKRKTALEDLKCSNAFHKQFNEAVSLAIKLHTIAD